MQHPALTFDIYASDVIIKEIVSINPILMAEALPIGACTVLSRWHFPDIDLIVLLLLIKGGKLSSVEVDRRLCQEYLLR